jgi:putative transposase
MGMADKELPNRKSIRLKEYDYARAGAYFVTICSWNKQCVFGTVEEDTVQLNELGRVVESCWQEIPEHFAKVELDEFIIMPNHIHGIIILNDQEDYTCRDTIHRVRESSGESKTESFGNPTASSIPTIIRTFKAAVTRESRRLRLFTSERLWQGGYFERIIRNENAMMKAREYIVNNPLEWHFDRENPAVGHDKSCPCRAKRGN